jgi:hypothetical protein
MSTTPSRAALQPRTPDLAPTDLPRQRRRHINRALYKLIQHNCCSLCGAPFQHNSSTASGLDAHGNVALAGECCFDRLAEIFGLGHFTKGRRYDFLPSRGLPKSDVSELTNEQIAAGIGAYQAAVAAADRRVDSIERHGGIDHITKAVFAEHPWKSDDRDWFEQNSKRSHRLRQPFPGELDELPKPQPESMRLIVVRQVRPGDRVKALISIPAGTLLPLPFNEADDEALTHALFEIAAGHEPMPDTPQAFSDLREKYTARQEAGK